MTQLYFAVRPVFFHFNRPGEEERRTVLVSALQGTGVDDRALAELVTLTGPRGEGPGFTYSDLTQRLVPSAIMAAFPDSPLSAGVLLSVAARMTATPEFSPTAS